MEEVLWKFGLGDRLMKWIKGIYSNPVAQVKVNGSISKQFEVTNGTRKGCPLSPLIFILTLKSLPTENKEE